MDGHQPILSEFVQDRIQVTPTLTVDLGLRYEIAPPLYDTRGQTMGGTAIQRPRNCSGRTPLEINESVSCAHRVYAPGKKHILTDFVDRPLR